MTIRSKANWYMYWYWHRRVNSHNIAHFIARHLPVKVRYWAVIVSAVKATDGNPSDVTAIQMMEKMEVK